MKKSTLWMIAALLALSGCAPQQADADAARPVLDRDVAILYTNDVHCAVDGGIGYAGVAAVKKELEDGGCYVALVDAGDAIQGAAIGTLTEGEDIVDIMNELGYDAAVPGNHEFDYGMERFLALTERANFPYISANFTDLTTGDPVLAPYTLLTFNGVKIAFVGVCTPKTIGSSSPAHFKNEQGEFVYGFRQDADGSALYSAVQTAADAARAEGAQFVVALVHLGIEATCAPWMSTDLIAHTNGIDTVIDGHSHTVIPHARVKNKDGRRVLLTQTGTGLSAVGLLYITRSGSMTASLITDKTAPAADAETDAYIKGKQAAFDALLNTVVAKSAVDLVINEPKTDPPVRIVRSAETNLGNLCADAFRWVTGADVAFVNGGGVRADIPAGDITFGQIITVQPFNNMICMVEATGQELLDALEIGARAVPSETGGFLQVSGLTYEIDVRVPSSVKFDDNNLFVAIEGARRVSNVRVGGVPIEPDSVYSLATYDNLIDNGDGYTMFADNAVLRNAVMKDSQALIQYIVEGLGGTVGEAYADPHGEGRIVAAG